MNKIFTLLFLSFFISGFSQTHRFIYEKIYKKDSADNAKTTEFYNLDINPGEIYFYARDYFVMDSIQKKTGELSISNPPNLSNIYIHKKNDYLYDTYELTEYELYHLKTNDRQNWILTNEVKNDGQFTVQKALTNWGGRNWIAWFTTEVPFSEGPYKFHGLPGLITDISDDKGNFSFKVVKSENYPETINVRDYFGMITMAIPVTEKQYRKLMLTYYQDPISFLKTKMQNFTFTDDNWVMLKDGTKVTKDNQREVIKQQQIIIKKFNNPIELDKAIKYPK